ncbi:MAG: hypothetical protein AABX89_07175 [Candidatus Thermoplasmatota archaeon]|mgnify:CR=1 FL=1
MSEADQYAGLFGSKTSKGQLQGGFLLLALGALLGLAALILFFIGLGQNDPSLGAANPYLDWAKAALTIAPVALGGILLGLTVALPTSTSLRAASYVGGFFLVVAAFLFFFHYPTNFNVAVKGSKAPDYLGLDLMVAVGGFILMAAALVSSIVGFYLGRTTVVKGSDGEAEDDIYGEGYEIPDWVVERDIEFAMKKYGVSWGSDTEDKTIRVNIADTFAGATIGGLGKARVVQLDADQVDLGVAGLTKVRPQKGGAIPGEWADEATRALVNFRKQKEANPKAFTPKRTFWQRVGDFFAGRNRGARTSAPAARVAPKAAPAGAPRANGASAPARRGKTIVIDDE